VSEGPTSGPAIPDAFRARGQGQVFRFFDELPPAEQAALVAQAQGIDLDLLKRLSAQASGGDSALPTLAPFTPITRDSPELDTAVATGRDLLDEGKVGFFTVAGGQGTRLGYDGPKGCYPLPVPSRMPLFAWFAECVRAASRRHRTKLPWVIMVSAANEEVTLDHFCAHDWFGLEGSVRFVRQRMLPAVDDDGRILLASRSSIALSPNGHGGSIDALADGGALQWFEECGVEVVSYFQVDNPLLNPADPAFLGFHRLGGWEMGAKVVLKSHPLERAGVVALADGKPAIVEYTELPEDLARATDAGGRLLYGLGNIAAHTLSMSFLRRMAGAGLPYHVARKKIPTLDASGEPLTVMGRKFETFIFDAIPAAEGFFAFLTERSEEFAPLKNAKGDDSPETVARALENRTREWFRRAGKPLDPGRAVPEITPFVAYDFDTFLLALPGLTASGGI
jgi:putative uridylyltransferase